jgi:hypothetical protein
MADVEMNKGVQILLERMNSNPDEFIPNVKGGYPAKWRDIILSVEMRVKGGKDYADQLSFLSDVEIIALWQKILRLQGELFTKQVMNTLLRGTEDGLDYSVGYSELVKTLQDFSTAELSSLSRQVAGASPKVRN